MNKFTSHKNQKGNALLIVLAFSAFAAVSIAALQSRLGTNRSIASKRAVEQEFKSILGDIKAILSNEAFCNNNTVGIAGLRLLNGRNPRTLAVPNRIRINFPDSSRRDFGPGWTNATGSLRFHSMRWEFVETEADDFVYATSLVRSKKVLYRLIVEMKVCDGPRCNNATSQFLTNASVMALGDHDSNPATPDQLTRRLNPYAIDIPLYMHLSANRRFEIRNRSRVLSCFGQDSGADFCEKIGGVWNPTASSLSMKCEPLKSCHSRPARRNNTCGRDPEVLARFSPIVEGVGKVRVGRRISNRRARGRTVLPDGLINPNIVNISTCTWCNMNL